MLSHVTKIFTHKFNVEEFADFESNNHVENFRLNEKFASLFDDYIY